MKIKFFKFIADLRFAIAILLIISFCSIIGTVIEQDQSIEIYKINYPITNSLFGFLSWEVILQLGFDHVYKTWWFISLILIFGISLLTCTFLQQFPSIKIARRCQFVRTLEPFTRLKISHKIEFGRNYSVPMSSSKVKSPSTFHTPIHVSWSLAPIWMRNRSLDHHFSECLIIYPSKSYHENSSRVLLISC